jgi:hypothetical protein
MIASLERQGIPDAEALVQRDALGDRPVVAERLLARAIAEEIVRRGLPRDGAAAAAILEGLAAALVAKSGRSGLPGWAIIETGAPAGSPRAREMTTADLLAALKDLD